MREEVFSFFYSFRHSFAGLAIIAIVLLFSTLTTTLGAGSVFDARTTEHAKAAKPSYTYSSPNAVSDAMSNMTDVTRRALLATGTAIYSASTQIHRSTAATAKTIGHACATGFGAIWHGIASGIGGIIYAARVIVSTPASIVTSVSHARSVSALIRPAENTAASVPVIESKTSSEILEHLSTQQRAKIALLLEEQKIANRQLFGTVIAGDPAHGGYPAKWDNAPQDSLVDSWGMYSRECVSYAAWKVYQTYGHMPYWGGVGNANLWVRNAQRAGIPTSSVPKPKSVAISMRGYYGHAMWVEKVAGDMIYVSQYNWDLRGHYSEMWAKANQFTYIYFN